MFFFCFCSKRAQCPKELHPSKEAPFWAVFQYTIREYDDEDSFHVENMKDKMAEFVQYIKKKDSGNKKKESDKGKETPSS